MLDWMNRFPQMNEETLRNLKRVIDDSFREFTRGYGAMIEGFFDPLRQMLIFSERLMLGMPWPLVLLIVGGVLMSSGVAASAAKMMSPSFSRSASPETRTVAS